jgi:hypothetical protein
VIRYTNWLHAGGYGLRNNVRSSDGVRRLSGVRHRSSAKSHASPVQQPSTGGLKKQGVPGSCPALRVPACPQTPPGAGCHAFCAPSSSSRQATLSAFAASLHSTALCQASCVSLANARSVPFSRNASTACQSYCGPAGHRQTAAPMMSG